MMNVPHPVTLTALLVAASLLGDGALYVVLPVLYEERGLRPMDVGLLLSANRWTRLLTNDPAAYLLGRLPLRSTFAGALLGPSRRGEVRDLDWGSAASSLSSQC